MPVSFTLSQDLEYPFAGETVTLRARNGTAGNRIRWRLASKPADSSLAIYDADAAAPAWLAGKQDNFAELALDTHGTFVATAVEEQFDSTIPHFSNAGSPSANPTEHWSEVTTESYTVYSGAVVERRIGTPPHEATVRAWMTASGPATEGVLTSYFDESRCPVLVSPTTDVATAAIGASEVVAHLARMGGDGYDGTSDLIAADGTGSGFLYSVFSILALLELRFNLHRANTTNLIHDATDVPDKVALALPTTEALLVAYANALRANYVLHLAKGIGTGHPNGADVTNGPTAAACADLATAISLLQNLWVKYSSHRVLYTGTGHHPPGDGRSRETPWPLASSATLAEACAFAYALGQVWNSHMDALGPGAGYHALADAENVAVEYTGVTLEDLIVKANTFADLLGAHCTNVRWDTKATKAYHTKPDYGGDTSKIPRASDWASAVQLVETCARIYLRHVDHDSSDTWHPGAAGTPDVNPGAWFVQLYGTALLNREFQDATAAIDLGTPGNAIDAINNVLTWGGFTKAAV